MDTNLSVSNGKWEASCYVFPYSPWLRELTHTHFPDVFFLISWHESHLNISEAFQGTGRTENVLYTKDSAPRKYSKE